MRNNDGIIVAGRDSTHRLLAVPSREMVLPCNEQPGLWVKLQKLCAPLIHQMVRHHEHRLLRQVKSAKFHGRRGHRPRFARPYDVGQQRASSLENAPDGVLLVWREVFAAERCAHHSGQRQMGAVEIPEPDVIEPEVVVLRQPFGSFAILPNPIAKPIL